MNFKIILKRTTIVILVFLIVFGLYSFINYRMSIREYKQNIEKTVQLTPSELDKKVNSSNHDIINIYFGRPSCPYCRQVAPEINKALNESEVILYYIETEKSDDNKELTDLRKKYDIEYVPTIIKIKDEHFKTFNPEENTLVEFLESH